MELPEPSSLGGSLINILIMMETGQNSTEAIKHWQQLPDFIPHLPAALSKLCCDSEWKSLLPPAHQGDLGRLGMNDLRELPVPGVPSPVLPGTPIHTLQVSLRVRQSRSISVPPDFHELFACSNCRNCPSSGAVLLPTQRPYSSRLMEQSIWEFSLGIKRGLFSPLEDRGCIAAEMSEKSELLIPKI